MDIAVSIIVPVYNVEEYIDRCMESLLNQTLKNIEIILVDDGSPDNCPSICDTYALKDTRVKVIHKKNAGLGYARNSGLKIATGEYVAFVDSDDYVTTDMYEKLYQYACEKKLDTVISGFNRVLNNEIIVTHREVDHDEIITGKKNIHQFVLDMLGAPATYKKDYKYEMSVWRGIYSNRIIQEEQIYFPSERTYISEDIIFHFDYFEYVERLGLLSDVFYCYCENGQSLTQSFREDRFEKNKKLYLHIIDLFSHYNYPTDAKEYADRMLLARIRIIVCQIINYLGNSDRFKAKQEIKKIAKDSLVVDLINNYNIKALPIQQRLFICILKYNFYYPMKIIVKMNNLRKDNR